MLFESGVHGVKLLMEKIQDPDKEPMTVVLPTELIVRETTALAVVEPSNKGSPLSENVSIPTEGTRRNSDG
jgi:hypothetical protein